MKITTKQFALALDEAVDGKSAGQVKAAIKKFVEILARKNMLAKADKISVQFAKIWNEKRGIIEAEAASARSLSRETIKLLKKYLAGLSGAKQVALVEKIDKSILGGVIIKYGDKVVDGSLKMALVDLKEKLIK